MLKLNSYSNFILKDISIEIEPSSNLIILGDNGAGKTTLAKILSGLIPTPNLSVDEQDLQKLWGCERASKVNYIPTKLDVFDEYLSVEEFLTLSHFNFELTIDDVLKTLAIEYLKDKPCKTLSSGESQLVLVASAILHNATFTIFDEIVSNLDPKRQKEIFNLLKQSKNLKSKIIITHNLDLAFKLGWDIVYIQNGEITFSGSNEKFFSLENLQEIFGNSVIKIKNHIVVDL